MVVLCFIIIFWDHGFKRFPCTGMKITVSKVPKSLYADWWKNRLISMFWMINDIANPLNWSVFLFCLQLVLSEGIARVLYRTAYTSSPSIAKIYFWIPVIIFLFFGKVVVLLEMSLIGWNVNVQWIFYTMRTGRRAFNLLHRLQRKEPHVIPVWTSYLFYYWAFLHIIFRIDWLTPSTFVIGFDSLLMFKCYKIGWLILIKLR